MRLLIPALDSIVNLSIRYGSGTIPRASHTPFWMIPAYTPQTFEIIVLILTVANIAEASVVPSNRDYISIFLLKCSIGL